MVLQGTVTVYAAFRKPDGRCCCPLIVQRAGAVDENRQQSHKSTVMAEVDRGVFVCWCDWSAAERMASRGPTAPTRRLERLRIVGEKGDIAVPVEDLAPGSPAAAVVKPLPARLQCTAPRRTQPSRSPSSWTWSMEGRAGE